MKKLTKNFVVSLPPDFAKFFCLPVNPAICQDVSYIGEAIKIARKYFKAVGIEVYPLNSDEYAYLHQCGADFVSVYQETYDPQRYGTVHPAGSKRSFPYRFNAQERALIGGMRGVSFGALLGLGNFRSDALAQVCMLTLFSRNIRKRKFPFLYRVFARMSLLTVRK